MKQNAIDFTNWLWNAKEIVHIGQDKWGIEKEDSIELEEREYTTEELFNNIYKK